jgi:integration host factor subunit beta
MIQGRGQPRPFLRLPPIPAWQPRICLQQLDFRDIADYTPLRPAMTKADLITIVAERLKITQVQSSIIVEAALRSVVNALRNGEEVEIRGFGSFRFRNRAPRKGRNPKTGEKVDVPPKKIPYFKMGKELKALLNGSALAEADGQDIPPPPVPPSPQES